VKKVLFIHRSVGRNLIKYGYVYNLLRQYEGRIDFFDYDHNNGVLSTANSHKKLGYVFPGRNTYPQNLAQLFGAATTKTKPILDWIDGYDIVVLKSCYPTTKIKSDKELEQKKQEYRQIATYFAKSGQHLGLLTSPPMKPRLTKPEWASRARRLSKWMTGTNLGENVKVFDLFDLLSADENEKDAHTLRKDYRRLLFFDAHPNRKANLAIAPKFVAFLDNL
jgi:hypothetical protein